MRYKQEKKEMIYWAGLLNRKGFVTVRSGNISSKAGNDRILITAHDSYLGHLNEEEIIAIDLDGNVVKGEKEPTSELRLHLRIHSRYRDKKIVIHAHPPFTTAFFHYFDTLDIFSFEAQMYLKDIKTIPQSTPTVSDVNPVVEALKRSTIVVLKNHGVVSLGNEYKEAFAMIELLEEQAKVNLFTKSMNLKGREGK